MKVDSQGMCHLIIRRNVYSRGISHLIIRRNVKVDSRGMSHLIVRRNSDITSLIIPFFAKYPLHGNKYADYLDFCKVAKIMDSKAHLTEEGLEQISRIKSGMNRGRFS